MKKILIALILALVSTLGFAKIIAKSTGSVGSILLMDEKCTEGPGGQQLVVIDLAAKKLGDGCWVKIDEIVYLMSPQLGNAVVPAEAFSWVEKETTRSGTI
jgi:hypothetical protein